MSVQVEITPDGAYASVAPGSVEYDDSYFTCEVPGRNGCGSCDGCIDWGDHMYDMEHGH